MKSIIKSIFICVVTLLLLTSFASIILSNTTPLTIYQTIEINHYSPTTIETESIHVTQKQLNTTTTLLTQFSAAVISNDQPKLQYYQQQLHQKGIDLPTPEHQQKLPFHTTPLFDELLRTQNPEESVDNNFCYVHITGQGTLLFTIATLRLIPTLILVQLLGTNILTLLIPLYLAIFAIAHIIPLRILLPIGTVLIDESIVTTIGTNGRRTLNVNETTEQLTLGGFTGVTLNRSIR